MKNKNQRSMYALAVLLATLSVTMFAGTLAWGRDWNGPYQRRANILTREQDNRLQAFLRNHPGVHRDLQRNPDLANDRSYLRSHDDFREFLSDHPRIRAAFRTDPAAVMASQGSFGPRRTWNWEQWRERYR